MFFCPISLKLLRDPVLLATGQTCDPRTHEQCATGVLVGWPVLHRGASIATVVAAVVLATGQQFSQLWEAGPAGMRGDTSSGG